MNNRIHDQKINKVSLRKRKLEILIFSSIIIGVSVAILFFVFPKTSTQLKISPDSKSKDYSQEYRELYDNTNYPLRAWRVVSIIENTAKRRKEVEKTMLRITEKECPNWNNCPLSIIANYLETKDALGSLNISPSLNSRLMELYNGFKQEKVLSDSGFSTVEDSLQMTSAKMVGLLDADEIEFWLKRIPEYISPSSVRTNLMILRFALDVHNIDDLEYKAREMNISSSKVERVKDVICTNIKIPTLSGVSLPDNKGDSNDLRKVWFYIARKRFCQIPITSQDQKLINKVVSKNYLKPITFFGVQDIDYSGESLKYLLVNSDKIFE